MKFKKLTALIAAGIMFLSTTSAFACTGTYVGKDVSDDGSVMVARTEDIDSGHAKEIIIYEREDRGDDGVFTDPRYGTSIPQPGIAYKYYIVPDCDVPSDGIYGAVGYNEFGVSITATVTGSTGSTARSADPFTSRGIIREANIPSIVLPRVQTAREGVEYLFELVEEYGSAEANVLMIADHEEAWYVEIYTGHRYAAVLAPEDMVAVFPNCFMLGYIEEADVPVIDAVPEVADGLIDGSLDGDDVLEAVDLEVEEPKGEDPNSLDALESEGGLSESKGSEESGEPEESESEPESASEEPAKLDNGIDIKETEVKGFFEEILDYWFGSDENENELVAESSDDPLEENKTEDGPAENDDENEEANGADEDADPVVDDEDGGDPKEDENGNQKDESGSDDPAGEEPDGAGLEEEPEIAVLAAAEGEVDYIRYEDVILSPDLKQFAVDNNFYAEYDGKFHIALSYGSTLSTGNRERLWGGQNFLGHEVDYDAEVFELFFKPGYDVSVKDVMELQRYRYEGTEKDKSLPENSGVRAIGTEGQAECHIIQIKEELPADVGGVLWLTMGNAEHTVYVPMYGNITDVHEAYKVNAVKYDPESAFWKFRGLGTIAELDRENYGASIREYWSWYQDQLIADQKIADKTIIELFNESEEKAAEYATARGIEIAGDAMDKADFMFKELFTHIAKDGSRAANRAFTTTLLSDIPEPPEPELDINILRYKADSNSVITSENRLPLSVTNTLTIENPENINMVVMYFEYDDDLFEYVSQQSLCADMEVLRSSIENGKGYVVLGSEFGGGRLTAKSELELLRLEFSSKGGAKPEEAVIRTTGFEVYESSDLVDFLVKEDTAVTTIYYVENIYDVDANGVVNWGDLAYAMDHYMKSAEDYSDFYEGIDGLWRMDFDGDGVITMNDYLILMAGIEEALGLQFARGIVGSVI